jgi:hypothetical protein
MHLQKTEAQFARDEWQRRFQRPLAAAALLGWVVSAPAAEPPKAPPGKKCEAVQATPAGDESIEWSGQCRAGKMVGKGIMTWRLNGDKLREFDGELANGLPQGKGVLQWSDGRRFEGSFAAGEPSGNGVLVFGSGERFEGAIANGLPEGLGRLVRPNGDRYDATFRAGEVQGTVDYAFGGAREGERFAGPVDKHQPHGDGTYFTRDGSSFVAKLAEGKIVSAGEFKYADGARWQGPVVGNRPDGQGIMLLANGDRIEGQLIKEQFASGASYHFAKGGRFVGTLSGNRPRGQGWLILPSGERIQGELSASAESSEAKVSGNGQIVYTDGRIYVGPLEASQPQGRGVLTLAGGERIEAYFRGSAVPQGNVSLEYPNGDRYAGELAELVPHGEGLLTTRAGHRYTGSFDKGLPNGTLEVTYADGRKYDGNYVAGERSGKGTFRWPDGAQYEGMFAAGLPHGKGTLLDGTAVRYSGQFAAGMPAGDGRLELPSGKVIEGAFHDGMANGKATLTLSDKSRFAATLSSDRIEGQGTYVGPDGKKSELAFTADLPKADDGPFFGIFKSKIEEIASLIDAGFYPWAQRYYLAHRKYFDEKKTESATLYARLRNGLAEGYVWREKHLRRLAQLPLLDAGRLRGDQDLALAGSFAEAALQQQAAARAVPLLADGLGSGQGNPVEELKPLWSAAYAEAVAMAIAAGRLDEADRISQAAGERKLQPINKAVDAVFSAVIARDPLLASKQQAAFDRLREDGVELDKAVVESGVIASLEAALRDGDVDKAFALLAVGKKLEFKLLAGERGDRFARQLAQRVAAKADFDAGFALLVSALETLKSHGDGQAAGELHAVWLEMFAKRVDKGEVKPALEALAKVGELGLKLAPPKGATAAINEAGRARLVSALGKRLDAYDAAGWLLVLETLAADGLDLAPAFRKKVVFLRTGAIGSRTPFALSVKNDGLFRFKVLDDLLEHENTLREELAGASYALIADIHPRLAVRGFARRSDVASTFPDGAVEVPNPAYLQLEQQIAEADAAAARAGQKSGVNLPTNSGNRNTDSVMGLLNVIGAIAEASTAGDAANAAGKAQTLRNRLASTPRTLSKPKVGNYNYQQAEIEALQIVPATLYMLNLTQKQYVRRSLAFTQRESFATTFGIHPKDKAAKPGERPDRIRQLERKPLSLSLSDLILAPSKGVAELLGDDTAVPPAPQVEPLANLPAALDETREKRDAAGLRWLEGETRKFDGEMQLILTGLHEEGRVRSEPIMEALRIPSDPSPEVTRNGAKLGHLVVRASGPVVPVAPVAPVVAAGAAVPIAAAQAAVVPASAPAAQVAVPAPEGAR